MDCHCRCAICFGNFRDFHGIDMVVIKAFAEFDGDRLILAFHQRFYDLPHQFRCLCNGAAFPVFDDFGRRTTHVHINDVKGIRLDFLAHFPQNFGIRTKKLDGCGTFCRLYLQQFCGVFVVI